VKYVNEFNDGNWLGNLYTFDGRVSTQVGDSSTHVTIGECLYTAEKTDNCENCRYAPCNARLIATPAAYKKHMGFCSKECYEKARIDGFIKVMEWDKMNYMELGREARNHPEKHDIIFQQIQNHLDKKLAKIEWNHLSSQKEKEIIEC
jgi:predicted sulfurtransferase